jgi:hypothetical protein
VRFFNLMIENGYADYCVLRATTLMYYSEPDVTKVWRVLEIASEGEKNTRRGG